MLLFRSASSPWLAALTAVLCAAGLLPADERPLRRTIDAELQAAWQREKLTPASRAPDAAFLRRVSIDLVGTIPTHDEAKRFLDDTDAKKRDKLIDRLLADPRFATAQADVWDLVLFGRNPAGGDATRKRDAFKKWLSGKFARNEPYDRWVRDLILAEQDGSQMFHVQFRNAAEDEAVAVSRIFLGTQLQCARCHDHPYENWTQKDFYGMAGFFVRLVVVEGGSGANRSFKIGEKSTGDVLFSGAAKDQRPGRRGTPVKPKFLGGAELDEPPLPKDFKEPAGRATMPPRPAFSRKEKLAAWLATDKNPWFARAAANRVWGQLMGRGFVHPVDDLGGKNDPTHPVLLQALTDGLVAHKFDLKWLIREIVSSDAYQLDCKGATTDALPKWFDRARVRPLSAEEIMNMLRTALSYDGARVPGAGEAYILRYFGEPTNGQGEFQGSLGEHLYLNNSGELRQMIARGKGNLADALCDTKTPAETRVDRLFLSVLTRLPTDGEKQLLVRHLSSSGKLEGLVEEGIWAVLNSAEFRFNH